MFNRDIAIKKITKMSKEQVSRVLIFMAGMEAEHIIRKQNISKQQRNPPRQLM
jgi:hypothetical protein